MPRYENGWIKLHRDILHSDLSSRMEILGLWTWILLAASYEEISIKIGKGRKKLPPGSVIFSVKGLADDFGVSRSTMKNWLSYLQRTERISLTCHTKGSFCVVLKWSKYQQKQASNATTKHQPDINPTSNEHQPDTYKETKKIRKKNTTRVVVLDFLSQELQEWIGGVSDTVRQKWLTRYHPDTITLYLQKAKDWSEAKGRRGGNVALLMNKFFEGVPFDAGTNSTDGFSQKQMEGFTELDKLLETKG